MGLEIEHRRWWFQDCLEVRKVRLQAAGLKAIQHGLKADLFRKLRDLCERVGLFLFHLKETLLTTTKPTWLASATMLRQSTFLDPLQTLVATWRGPRVLPMAKRFRYLLGPK